MDLYPHELSGGMAQRVMIAMALAVKPKLLIADEPTSALDVTIQAQILQLLDELVRVGRNAVILITHDLGIASEFCDRITVMYAGNAIEISSSEEIFEEPLHPYTKGLIDSIPIIGASKVLSGIPGSVPDLIAPPPGCRFHPRCDFCFDKCCVELPDLKEVKPAISWHVIFILTVLRRPKRGSPREIENLRKYFDIKNRYYQGHFRLKLSMAFPKIPKGAIFAA